MVGIYKEDCHRYWRKGVIGSVGSFVCYHLELKEQRIWNKSEAIGKSERAAL